jgi:hypothetical protein
VALFEEDDCRKNVLFETLCRKWAPIPDDLIENLCARLLGCIELDGDCLNRRRAHEVAEETE